MKRMLVSVLAALCLLIPVVAAADPSNTTDTSGTYSPFSAACAGDGSSATPCSTDGTDPITGTHGVLHKASLIIATIAGVAAVIIIFVGAFQYVTSAGDAQKAANARNTILGAAIGLAVIVAAQVIVLFVLSRLN